MNDYYAILGVSPDATPDEIKAAFRKLAKEHHPDREGGNEEEFKKINEAHDILSDPDKRQQYDRIRSLLVPSEDTPTLKPQAGMILERTCLVKRSGLNVMAFMEPISNVNILIRDCAGILASEHILVTVSGTRENVRDFFDHIEHWVV